MRSLSLLLVAAAVTGCQHRAYDLPDRASPRPTCRSSPAPITRSTCAAPAGALDPAEAQRLDAWFSSLGLRYGDTIYVDGSASQMAVAHTTWRGLPASTA